MPPGFPSSVTAMNPDGIRAGMSDGGPNGPLQHQQNRQSQDGRRSVQELLPPIAFVPTLSNRQREDLDRTLGRVRRD
ncbi:MAG TPA: hypothetical protein VK145_03360 [Candidatus Nanoarchaeia archaeon]|nr:hypothetical protein [Candidatus Nanoarchaeia archaeon]